MALLGSIEQFSPKHGDWAEYVERLEQYFLANDIKDEKKQTAVFLTLIGSETYSLLRNLMTPEKPSEKPIKTLVGTLSDHLNPKPITIAERYKFYQRDQEEGESLGDYVAALRKLSEHCEFGTFLNQALRDKFVCGIQSQSIRKRLLAERDLELQKAIQLATGFTEADMQSNIMSKTLRNSLKEENTHKMNFARKTVENHPPPQRACYRCNDKNHLANACPYKHFTCRKCKTKGHLAKACRKSGFSHTANKIEEEEYPDSPPEEEIAELNNMQGGNAFTIEIMVNKEIIKFEIDTGSSITIVSEKDFIQTQLAKTTQLEKSNIIIKTYSGEQLEVVGKFMGDINHNGEVHHIPIHVVKGNGCSLLGRDFIRKCKLDWSSVNKLDCSLNKLLETYPMLFSDKLGKMKDFQAKINVKPDSRPKFCKPRNVPFAMQDAVVKELDRLEGEGILRSIDYSEWASPIVVVPKPDGNIRICADYKNTVNPCIEADQYPLPTADELFTKIKGGKTFTKIDLRTAYLQIELHPESRKYLVINTIKGLKEFTRMPYGVTPASAIFQRKLEGALKDVPMTVVKIDDILVTGVDEEDHMRNLKSVLDILSNLELTLNKSKCRFNEKEVEYLGFILDKDGIRTNPDKVEAITNAPTPKNVPELQSFLGGINYYGKFIPHMATITAPLYKLLQKDVPWQWTDEQQEAFTNLKSKLSDSPILMTYDSRLKLKLACDASSFGVGAVLSHVLEDNSERPIGYASRSLNKHERMYSQLDKEGVGIIFGIKKFHQYLYGRHFTLETDNKALSRIFDSKRAIPTLAAARLIRWSVMLCAYDYDIQFRTTKEHANADMLSRLPLSTTSTSPPNAINAMQIDFMPITAEQLRNETQNDQVLKQVHEYCLNGKWPNHITPELKPYFDKRDELSIEDGILLWGLRVVVPLKYRCHVMRELHSSHPGIVRMKALSRIHIWFPNIDSHIEKEVRNCTQCAQVTRNPAKAYIHPWNWPTNPFDRVHVDFFGPFLGKHYLLLVDSHSKWIEVEIMKNTDAFHTVAVLRKWFARFGAPIQLVSDNGAQFISSLFEDFMKANGIKHIRSSAYHPSSNGGAERFVQTVKSGLRAVGVQHGDAEKKLHDFLMGYRSTPTTTTKATPCELFLGRQIRTRLDLLKPKTDNLRQNLHPLQEQMKSYENKMADRGTEGRQRVRQFEVGEQVLIRNFPHKQKWISGTVTKKLADRTYIINIGEREVKRHIDHIAKCPVKIEGSQSTLDEHLNIPDNAEPPVEPANHHQPRKEYPRRVRRPVPRYGIDY